jgi:hypothetical protein
MLAQEAVGLLPGSNPALQPLRAGRRIDRAEPLARIIHRSGEVTVPVALAAVPSRGAGGAMIRGRWLWRMGSDGARRPAAQGGLAARTASRERLRR